MITKRWLALLAILALVMGATPALAVPQVTLTQSHGWNPVIIGDASFFTYDPNQTFSFASAFSWAAGNMASDSSTTDGASNAVASIAYGSATDAFFLQSMFSVPAVPYGSTSYTAQSHLLTILRVGAIGGDVVIDFSNNIGGGNYDLLNNAIYPGTGVAFFQLNAQSTFSANAWSGSQFPSGFSQDLLASNLSDPIQVADFGAVIGPIGPFSFSFVGLNPGALIYLDLDLTTTLDTQSHTVPIPPALLLFGSGLGGLLVFGRRMSRS
jgi:hypothetical protein